MNARSALPVLVSLVHFGCGPGGGGDPVVLDGTYGFEVQASVALLCPPDPQGQFMKVYVEGTASTEGCDMAHPRTIPTTCEDRRAYLDAVPDVCLGAPSVAGPNVPLLDQFLAQEGDGWTDFDFAPLVVCDDQGREASVGLYGSTTVQVVGDDRLNLDFTLTNEEGTELLLAGSVDVPICP